MDVSLEGENSQTLCTTCSRGSMGNGMATTTAHLFHYEVSHMRNEIPYDDDFQIIIYGETWAIMIYSARGDIFRYLVFILSLEGNYFAAQDQPTLYTYHKWRDGQRGVGYIVYHVHIFIPPTLLEPKVEESF